MRLSVATFNVENLIGPGKPIYDEPRPRYTPAQYKEKTSWICAQLRQMAADIVGFQEVFEQQALADCIAGTHMQDWHLHVADAGSKGPANAVLSRLPFKKIEIFETVPTPLQFFDDPKLGSPENVAIPITKFSRPVLKATVRVKDNLDVNFFVLHLKSKNPIFEPGLNRDQATYVEQARGAIRSLIRRSVECCGVREILSNTLAAEPATPIILVGDLNDNDTAVTNQAILGEPPYQSLPLDVKIARWAEVFQNSKDIQARKSIENFNYSYIHNGHYESLDNIFLSNHFADQNKNKLGRVMDVRAYNDHLIDNTLSQTKKPFYVSDHGQICVNIDILDTPPTLTPMPQGEGG